MNRFIISLAKTISYGLQLCTRVKQSEQDPKSTSLTIKQINIFLGFTQTLVEGFIDRKHIFGYKKICSERLKLVGLAFALHQGIKQGCIV